MIFVGILTCYFSLGQVLRVPLLASGHRPGIYTGIARRAALEGSALVLLLLLLLYSGRNLAPKPAARWPPQTDRSALAQNVALELTPARWISLQRAAAPALCGDRPWRDAGRPGARSEFSAKVVARRPSSGAGVGLSGSAFRRFHTICQRRAEKGAEWSEVEERRGKSAVSLMDSHYLCPLSGHPGHRASLSGESR